MPPAHTLEGVALDRIDLSDDTFRITTGADLSAMAESIAAVGVLSPPILVPAEGRQTVVCGFRRIEACRILGRGAVACRILSPEETFLSCAQMAVADNTACRRLNPVELSRAFHLLSMAVPAAEDLPEVAGKIGLPTGAALIEKLKRLCRAPEAIQQGVIEERIALPVALELAKMPEPSAAAAAAVLSSVSLSLNRQREVLSLIREIGGREEMDLPAVAGAPAVRQIVADEQATGPQKARALLAYLKRRRFPHLSRAEAVFEQKRSRLPLTEGMTLAPPPGFEGNRHVLKLSFQSSKQLAVQIDRAREVAQSPVLQEILDET